MTPSAAARRSSPHDPTIVAACCADLWSHPGMRLLLGDALHPGGEALTGRALDLLDLTAGARVLDVGTGPGASRVLAARRGLRPVGIDRVVGWPGAASAGSFVGGDAERLPFADASFGGAVAECVLSVVADKEAVSAELARVVIPGGRVAVADVVRRGPLPRDLDTVLGWVACAGGALPEQGYAALLSAAGFRPLSCEDHTMALAELVAQALRRLALFEGAMAAGLLDQAALAVPTELMAVGRSLLTQAADAIDAGAFGYVLVVASRAAG